MHISESDIDIGLNISHQEDPELKDIFQKELTLKAKPLLNNALLFAHVSACKDAPLSPANQEEIIDAFHSAFLLFTGSVWAALGCHLPSIRKESIDKAKTIKKPLWIIIESLQINSSEKLLKEIYRILEKPCLDESHRKLLFLCDVVLDAVYQELEMQRASNSDVIETAERILRLSA